MLPHITQASRDYHLWKYNEMFLETYAMAKKRKDTKTMERAAASYAKFNNVNVEDEQPVPYDMIVVQTFTSTQDPSVRQVLQDFVWVTIVLVKTIALSINSKIRNLSCCNSI